MPPLYEITADIQAIMHRLEAADGELTADLAAELDGLQLAFEDKIENVLKYRAGQVAVIDGIDHEIRRLSNLRDGYIRRAESLWRYVFRSMQALGVTRIVGKLFTVWQQKNSRPSIEVYRGADGVEDIPAEYQKTTLRFDSEKAYDDWRGGKPLPPGVTVKEGYHLRVN
jgi:hypothetical protein